MSNRKIYRIKLTPEEQNRFAEVGKGKRGSLKIAVWKVQRANAMLKCDESDSGPAWSDERIAEAFGITIRSIENWRKQAFEKGPLSLLERKKRLTPPTPPILDGKKEAQLTKLACSTAPDGRSRWTHQLMADKLVELEIVDSISADTVGRVQKNILKPWLKSMWCIPPSQDSAFVAAMEQVLDIYQRPYDPLYPVVNMDEQPIQLVSHSRQPLPMRPNDSEKIDYEYVREGMCNAFMFVEPLGKWREVHVSKTKTALDWARYVKWLVDHPRFAEAERITLVSDNLNTHCIGSLYAAFEAEEAFRLMSRLTLAFTPKHGSWLNMAEPELSVMTRQCFADRVGSEDQARERIDSWFADRNKRQIGID